MLFRGVAGSDIVLVAYVGNKASGTITLWYTGHDQVEDPTHPGVTINPKTSTPSGSFCEYVLSASLLATWLQNDHRLRFTAMFQASTVDQSDWHCYLRLSQKGEKIQATEARKPLNGDQAPFDDVECGISPSAVPFDQPFTVTLA